MITQSKITISLIVGIIAGIVGRCAGQAPEIPTYPTATTDAVTLKDQPTHPVINDVDPISQRLTITYAPITERKTRGLKIFARKLRRIFRPNEKT